MSTGIYTAHARPERSHTRELVARQSGVIALSVHALSGATAAELFDEATNTVRSALHADYAGVLQQTEDGLDLKAGTNWRAGHADGALEAFIVDEQTRPWGIIGAYSGGRDMFDDADRRFLQSVAAVLSVALQRERAIRTFSHDVRNALSTIQCCAAILRAPKPASASAVRHAADVIHRSAAWLQQIVQERVDAPPTADALTRSTSPTRLPSSRRHAPLRYY